MNFPRRSRYKDARPVTTINRVRQILRAIGVLTDVEFYEHSGNCHSCRLKVINEGLEAFDIGVNGKGMTKDYALASAYGELMERLQNKALFREGIRYAVRGSSGFHRQTGAAILGYMFAPDEKVVAVTRDTHARLMRRWFPMGCDRISIRKISYETIMLPFTRIIDGQEELLPIELVREMCGTTGMCAGNTRAEAISQGLYEIQERYVLQRVYINEPILPNIDLSLFRHTKVGRDIVADAKRRGIEYRVKDCSLGGRFPVLGLVIIDKKNGAISFRLGADYNIITALERCYTETYQGGAVSSNVFKGPAWSEAPSALDYRKSCENGTGVWPSYLLDVIVQPNRFPHHDGQTSEETCKFVVEKLEAQGYQVYCRDNSILEFPAFHLYVPGLSDVHSSLNDINESIRKRVELRQRIPPLWRIPRLPKAELRKFAASLAEADVTIKTFPWLNDSGGKKYSRFLQAGCALILGDTGIAIQALEHLKIDLENRGIKVPTYYEAYIACLKLRLSGSYDLQKERLVSLYGSDLVREIEDEIEHPKDGFVASLPNCFNCRACKLFEQCCYRNVVELESRIQIAQRRNT